MTSTLSTATLTTARLRLRQLRPADAPRLQALCGNWNVARMLEVVPHPYPDGLAEEWIASRPAAWRDGSAYTFAIEFAGELVGIVAIERQDNDKHVIAYWLGEPWWGQGLMSEAVGSAIGFAADTLALEFLASAYFTDNPASGRILQKHGFRITGHGRAHSKARGCDVAVTFMRLQLASSA